MGFRDVSAWVLGLIFVRVVSRYSVFSARVVEVRRPRVKRLVIRDEIYAYAQVSAEVDYV